MSRKSNKSVALAVSATEAPVTEAPATVVAKAVKPELTWSEKVSKRQASFAAHITAGTNPYRTDSNADVIYRSLKDGVTYASLHELREQCKNNTRALASFYTDLHDVATHSGRKIIRRMRGETATYTLAPVAKAEEVAEQKTA